jgi:hypothetical protein
MLITSFFRRYQTRYIFPRLSKIETHSDHFNGIDVRKIPEKTLKTAASPFTGNEPDTLK